MKKILLGTFLFLIIFNFKTNILQAAAACPTTAIQCGELDASGGCQAPCLRIVTSVGGKGPSWCACQKKSNIPPGSVSCGGTCQISVDCASGCAFCRAGGPGTGQTCQTLNTATPIPFAGLCIPTGGTANTGIDTAIGCIPILSDDNGVAFYGFILKWAIGIAGGIAFLLIVYAGFMIMTSSGNPDRLKAGQELLTSAISGLILLVLSVFILDLIGVKILRLPGLPQ